LGRTPRASAKFPQVINAIQTGPYKNIYNPENFFIGKQGIGAGNNWGAGYAAGEVVQEEVFDMIDREADGSDSLEVVSPALRFGIQMLNASTGFHATPLHCWWYRVGYGKLHPRENE
jgi:hypothetical protein